MPDVPFCQRLQEHAGSLVRLRAGLTSPAELDRWDGRVCLLLEVRSWPTHPGTAAVELFVDGRVILLWLTQREIELIGDDDV